MARKRWLATLLLVPLLQCQDGGVTAPDVPHDIQASAIRLRVDVLAGTVTQVNAPLNPDISFSFVGPEGVFAQTSNLSQTALGRNKTLVQFDVAITNGLSDVTLITPLVPVPPPGTTGLVLFPLQATVVTGSGSVVPSTDWDGAPFNFFTGGSCKGAGSNCFRWEEFAAPLASRATSPARTVGFEMDRNVTAFDVVMLLAADLRNGSPVAATITLSPTTANFQATAGTTTPTSMAVLVSNSGGSSISGLTATVTYQAGQTGGWLTAELSSTSAPAVLTLTPFAVGLNDGTYTATVDVAAAGTSNSPQTVTVTLVVTGSVIANAIYVSESDPNAVDDATCGLGPFSVFGHPCRSISQGLARSVATGRPEVRVADGRYTESVVLVNGKSLLGGYQPDTWQRHVASTNTIIDGVSSTGNHDRTVIASGITSPTMFEGFVVRGAANAKPGGNSYAVYVSNSPALTISRNAIFGGSGGPGSQGSAGVAGSPGADGVGRASNPAGYDSKVATGTGACDASNNRSYANGGSGIVGGDDVSGGNGGGNVCPPSSTFTQQSAQSGSAGFAGDAPRGGTAGTLGAGGLDFRHALHLGSAVCQLSASGTHVGGAGGLGGNGQHGAAASGATDATGSVVSSHWAGASGGAGQPGGNGGGGGGGGAGGGAFTVDASLGNHRLGGVGGGGGAGGAGGGGGGGGSAGGGSFGIFIVGAAPAITDNVIVRGTGGIGGAGGGGATGALGGEGGEGGLAAVFCTEAGGRGGDGGQGGTGSGGGGGSGGGSFGIFTSGAGTPSYCTSNNNTISGGAGGDGGQGGASQVNPGGSGVAGALVACSFH